MFHTESLAPLQGFILAGGEPNQTGAVHIALAQTKTPAYKAGVREPDGS